MLAAPFPHGCFEMEEKAFYCNRYKVDLPFFVVPRF